MKKIRMKDNDEYNRWQEIWKGEMRLSIIDQTH